MSRRERLSSSRPGLVSDSAGLDECTYVRRPPNPLARAPSLGPNSGSSAGGISERFGPVVLLAHMPRHEKHGRGEPMPRKGWCGTLDDVLVPVVERENHGALRPLAVVSAVLDGVGEGNSSAAHPVKTGHLLDKTLGIDRNDGPGHIERMISENGYHARVHGAVSGHCQVASKPPKCVHIVSRSWSDAITISWESFDQPVRSTSTWQCPPGIVKLRKWLAE